MLCFLFVTLAYDTSPQWGWFFHTYICLYAHAHAHTSPHPPSPPYHFLYHNTTQPTIITLSLTTPPHLPTHTHTPINSHSQSPPHRSSPLNPHPTPSSVILSLTPVCSCRTPPHTHPSVCVFVFNPQFRLFFSRSISFPSPSPSCCISFFLSTSFF